MAKPEIKEDKLSKFRPQTRNPNKHTERGLKMLDASYQEVGYVAPMTAAANGDVLDGNARLERAFEQFPDEALVIHHDGKRPIVMVRDDISDADTPQAKRISYSANRIGEVDLSWDPEVIWNDIQAGAIEAGALWEKGELDALLAEMKPDRSGEDTEPQIDKAAELQAKWGTAAGQVWELGTHRVVCGDCTDKAVVEAVMRGEKACCTVTDPPYGIGVDYQSFFDTKENVRNLISKIMPIIFGHLPAALTPGIPLMWDYPHPDWIGDWLHPSATSSGPWGFVNSNLIFYYGKDPYLSQGKGRRESSITLVADRGGNIIHPVSKPLKVWEWLVIRLSPKQNDTIFDPFLGSGTTLIACENLSRRCRGIEISPEYVAVCLDRFWRHTNVEPKLIEG